MSNRWETPCENGSRWNSSTPPTKDLVPPEKKRGAPANIITYVAVVLLLCLATAMGVSGYRMHQNDPDTPVWDQFMQIIGGTEDDEANADVDSSNSEVAQTPEVEEPEDTTAPAPDEPLSQSYLQEIHQNREFFLSVNRVFEMTTDDGVTIRCGFEDHYEWLCASDEPYWSYANSDNAINSKDGTPFSGSNTLVDRLWNDDAEIIDSGRTAQLPAAADTGVEYGWVHFDGRNVVRGGISGSNGTSAVVNGQNDHYVVDI